MDPSIASSIFHFVLRQPIDDRAVALVLDTLPSSSSSSSSSSSDPNLRKSLLLRRIESDLRRRSISERILDSLELVEETDRAFLGKGLILPSMRAAYCAVAAECAAAALRRGAGFADAVERIWGLRVADLERSEAGGLASRKLLRWRRLMEAAVGDETVRALVVGADMEDNAVRLLGRYLDEVRKEMGRPLLQLAAERGFPSGDARIPAGTRSDGVGEVREEFASQPRPWRGEQGESQATEEQVRSPLKELEGIPSHQVDDAKTVEKSSSANAEILRDKALLDSEAMAAEILCTMALKMGSLEEQEHPQTLGSVDASVLSPAKDREVECLKEMIIEDHGDMRSSPNHGLLFQKQTASTFKSNGDHCEFALENGSRKIHMRSLKRRKTDLLDLPKSSQFTRRRAIKRWTLLEEATLREAVQKHGVGNWKFILTCYSSVFEGRTQVDLKDKWRNMTK